MPKPNGASISMISTSYYCLYVVRSAAFWDLCGVLPQSADSPIDSIGYRRFPGFVWQNATEPGFVCLVGRPGNRVILLLLSDNFNTTKKLWS